jgi:excisionase family DNA binding protein
VDERWYTVEQIAELLQVHHDTVRRWLRTGALKGRGFGGRTGWRVRESDLRRFLEGNGREQKAAWVTPRGRAVRGSGWQAGPRAALPFYGKAHQKPPRRV